MKAVLFPSKNQIEWVDRPCPSIGAGEALVEVKFAGICGSDVHVLEGKHATATYPRIPGHEFSGVLREANGALRDGIQVGDSVVVQPFWTCGTCEPCFTGHDNVCTKLNVFGIHQDGCFAQYIRVPAHKVYRLPDHVSLRLGALTEPLAVAVHDVRESGLSVGQRALVVGGGPIGLLVALVAQQAGASRVTISEVNDYRVDFAESLGIDVINPAKEDFNARVSELTNGSGFDVVYETSGSKPGLACATQSVKIRGTIMIIGIGSELFPMDTVAIFSKELTLKGVRIHAQSAFEGAIRLLETGSINDQLEQIITKVFPFEAGLEAFRYQMEDAHHFKVLVEL